jgi:hypothetical protein
MKKLTHCLILLSLASTMLSQPSAAAEKSQVITYPFPEDISASERFHVTVDGQPVFTHATEVADFAMFAIRGAVQVTVTCDQPVGSAVVRPRSRNIVPQWEAKSVRLTVDGPGPLSLEINGKIRPALLLFIDPPEESAPPPDAPNVMRFAGGKVHEAGEIRLSSDQTLYLEPGAVVRGTVRANGAKGIRILGRGIFDARERTTKTQFLDFRNCSELQLNDVLVLGSYGWTIVPWNCRDVTLTNVKVFSWRDNDDGLDICSSRNVTVDRCFFRTKDDCIAIKAPRKEYFPAGQPPANSSSPVRGENDFDVDTVVVQRSVFWNAEWGNALEIGFELRTPQVKNILWRDCDIIHVERGAVFSVHNGDFASVQDVRFEDIRVEDARDKLLDLRVGLSIYSQDCPERYHRRNPQRKPTGAGQWVPWDRLTADEQAVARQNRGAIRNVRLTDIQLLEKVPPQTFLINSGGELSGVTFQNVRQGDRVLGSAEDLGLSVEDASDVRFMR